jgi:hypothetical protein
MLLVVTLAVLAACVCAQQVQYLPLSGTWSVTNGSSAPIAAVVPGQIHMDLLNAKIIGLAPCLVPSFADAMQTTRTTASTM